jgi:hypothetical protein
MFSLSVKPCLQQHKWSLYLNAPIFTTTVIMDHVSMAVSSEEKVSDLVDKVQDACGMSKQSNRRVEGFMEDWVKVGLSDWLPGPYRLLPGPYRLSSTGVLSRPARVVFTSPGGVQIGCADHTGRHQPVFDCKVT